MHEKIKYFYCGRTMAAQMNKMSYQISPYHQQQAAIMPQN
jgi:hypothetical protein